MRTGRAMSMKSARAMAMAAGLAAAGGAHGGLFDVSATWVDTGGGNWATASNWSNGASPNNVFPNRYNVFITLPGSYTVSYTSGTRTIDGFDFTATGALLNGSGGTLNVFDQADIRGTYRSSGSHTLALGAGAVVSSTGVLEGNGVIVSNGLLRNEGVIRSRSGTLTLNALGGLDLDGGTGDGSMFATEASGGGITVTGGLNDAFDGLVNIGSGNTIAFNNGWTLNNSGALGFVNNGGTGDALLAGGAFESNGTIAVAGINARISAPTTFTESATTTVASGGELEFDGAVTFTGRDATRGLTGATFDGAGRLRFDGNITVADDSAATIRTAQLDWDGNGSGHQTIIGRNSSLTLESEGVDQGDPAGDGYDGTLTLNSGALFAFGQTDWRMDGTVNFNSIDGFNVAVINNNGAGRIDFRGHTNVVEFGFVTGDAKYSSTSSVFLSNADTVLGFGGPIEIAGASFTGAGRIESFGDWFFSADTTIETGFIDFEATQISPGDDFVTLGANVDLTLDGTEVTDTQNNLWQLLNGSSLNFNGVASGLSLGDLSEFSMTNSTVSFDNGSGMFSTNGQLSGSGTIDAQFSGGSDSHIIAIGNLSLGKAGHPLGFSTQGDLTVGGFTVTLNDSGSAQLGDLTTIAGGTLRIGGGGDILTLGSGETLRGRGTVEGRLSMVAGSHMIAEGGELTIDYGGLGGIQWNDVTVDVLNGATLTILNDNSQLISGVITIDGGTINAMNGLGTSTAPQLLIGNGTINGRLINGGGAMPDEVEVVGGTLSLGNASETVGSIFNGHTRIGDQTLHLMAGEFTANRGLMTLEGGTLTSDGSHLENTRLGFEGTIRGHGSLDLPIVNEGIIESVGGSLDVHGLLTHDEDAAMTRGAFVPVITGEQIVFNLGGGFEGNGTIDAKVATDQNAVLTATGDLAMGDATSAAGVIILGTLEVGAHEVELRDSSAASLGVMTTMDGGTLRGANGLSLGTGDSLVGSGVVDGAFSGLSGSTVTATGDLEIGNLASNGGFSHGGLLEVGAHDVTLLDSNNATVDDVTIAGGGLHAPNGIKMSLGDTLTGFGTVTADLNNLQGDIVATGSGIVFGGNVVSESTGTRGLNPTMTGTRYTFDTGSSFKGSGVIDAAVDARQGSTITATGDLTMGDSSSATGVNILGTLEVGEHEVTLRDSSAASLGVMTTIDGGRLRSANGLSLGVGDRLEGDGVVVAPTTHVSGTLAPGMSAGMLNIVGDLTMTSLAEFEVELGGLGAGEFDQVTVTGDASLGGTLRVSFIDGHDAAWGDSWEVVSAGSVLGGFDAFDLPTLSEGLAWFTDTTASAFTLGVRDFADVDANGVVNFADLNAVLAQFGSSGMGLIGDANGDGTVDFSDVNAVLVRFGESAPVSRAVPTPGAAALLMIGLGVSARRERRRTA